MLKSDSLAGQAAKIRRQAEKAARKNETQSTVKTSALSPEEIQSMVHELRVHQIELEMQNEELRRVQAELEVERERYFNLFELAPVSYCIVNAKGFIEKINLAAASLLGLSRSVRLKQPLSRFIDKEDTNIFYLKQKQLLETGEPQSYELRMRKKDGTLLWVYLEATAVRTDDGSTFCQLMLNNITERRKAEKALRESEGLHRTILETAMAGFWIVDMQGRLLEVNQAYCRMSGYTQQELLTMRRSDLEAVETPADIAAHVQKIMEQGHDHFVSKHRRKDGSLFDVDINTQYRPEEGGRMVAFLRDITERKKTEETLKKSEAKFSKIFKNSPIAMSISTTSDGRIIEVNEAFISISGLQRGQIIGRTSTEIGFWSPERRKQVMSGVVSGGNIRDFETTLRMPSGEIREVLLSVELIEIDEVKCILLQLMDITERKKAEDKLEESFEKLEKSYQKEKHLREELQAEAKARGMFIDILAHELRTPLTPVAVCSAMLRDMASSRDIGIEKKLVESMFTSTQALTQRLEELLDLGIFSRGTFTLHKQPVNLTDVVSKTAARFKPLAEQQSRQLVLEIQDSLPEIEADPARLEQVISNLLSNAIKYSPQNSSITLRAGKTDHGIVIEVQDEGKGITPEEQKKLFDPYHRVQQDTQKYQGIGLGLAICKQIVEAHGGSIGIESHSNINTCFRVEIPVKNTGGKNENSSS